MLFCFQAEDGIRDLVRSRGLGDVYKRQVQAKRNEKRHVRRLIMGQVAMIVGAIGERSGHEAVSYTHLTLPTSDLV